MDELPPATDESQPVVTMSMPTRLMNMFAAPGEVFEEVRASKSSTANWLVPVLLACLSGILFVVVAFSQPAILQQIKDQQESRLQSMAQKYNWSQDQADEARTRMESFMGPTFLRISGSIGAVVGSLGWVFAVAFGLWFLGTVIFKRPFPFMKAVEVTGLSSMIGVLGGIVTLFLVMARGTLFATLSPAFFLREPDPTNKVHLVLQSLNLVTIWYIAVLALGLSKLTGTSYAKSALWLFGIWLVIKGGMIFSGMAGFGM